MTVDHHYLLYLSLYVRKNSLGISGRSIIPLINLLAHLDKTWGSETLMGCRRTIYLN